MADVNHIGWSLKMICVKAYCILWIGEDDAVWAARNSEFVSTLRGKKSEVTSLNQVWVSRTELISRVLINLQDLAIQVIAFDFAHEMLIYVGLPFFHTQHQIERWKVVCSATVPKHVLLFWKNKK
jgi:hypothetical protein